MDIVAVVITLAAIAAVGWVFYDFNHRSQKKSDSPSGTTDGTYTKTPYQAPAE